MSPSMHAAPTSKRALLIGFFSKHADKDPAFCKAIGPWNKAQRTASICCTDTSDLAIFRTERIEEADT